MNDAALHGILNEIDVSYNGRLELWDYFQVKAIQFHQLTPKSICDCSTQRFYQNAFEIQGKINFAAKGRTKMLNDSFGRMFVALDELHCDL